MVLPIHKTARRPRVAMPRNSTGIPTPTLCKSATTSAPPTMNAAFSTLTAATTRARRWGAAQAWIAAKDGTIISPPATARMARSIAACQAIGRAKNADGATDVIMSAAGKGRSLKPEIKLREADQQCPDGSRQQHDPPRRQPRGEGGADRDGDCEDREEDGHDGLATAERAHD